MAEQIFSDSVFDLSSFDSLLLGMDECDDELFCGPPIFDLPPPPRPPWLDDLEGGCLDSAVACDNTPIVSTINNFQDIFHSVSIIVVSSIIIVISILLAAVVFWRRRQRLIENLSNCGKDAENKHKHANFNDGNYMVCGQVNRPSVQNRNKTLPNHYISDHGMVVDLMGKTALVEGRVPHLVIGGVPFQVVAQGTANNGYAKQQEGSSQYTQRDTTPMYTQDGVLVYTHNGVPMYTREGVPVYTQSTISTMAPSPIYETIDSEGSEWSSGYSERGEVGSILYQDLSGGTPDMGQQARAECSGETPRHSQYRGNRNANSRTTATQPRAQGGARAREDRGRTLSPQRRHGGEERRIVMGEQERRIVLGEQEAPPVLSSVVLQGLPAKSPITQL